MTTPFDRSARNGALDAREPESRPSEADVDENGTGASARAGALLDSLELPEGLRRLSPAELAETAEALRTELIATVSDCGGHFASSLGVAELTTVIHAAFETPDDRVFWDVGHQAYVHKMLTGRRGRMSSIRKADGISGFLKREESPYDAFGAGHAGTSISAAVGAAVAAVRAGTERYVVAVIGDGSMTSGMAFEAMNHAGSLGLSRFVVVLNDNEMSISPNVGAISWLFSRAVTSKASNWARSGFKSLYRRGYVPKVVYRAIDKAEEAAQSFFTTPAMLFEAFGFRYIGPVDGHDVDALLTAFRHAKEQDVPVLVHVSTRKGKGYPYAEEDPLKWHAVIPFDRDNGKFLPTPSPAAPSYTSVFADTLVALAGSDERVVGITAAMASGTGLDKLQAALPARFFDVGICEQHAVTFAAGLAAEGFRPVCAIYSTFLQRAYDQVVHDVCVQNLPVVFAVDRGGVVGNDGETHQGVFDIAYLRTVPNIVVMSPADEDELRHMLKTALGLPGPSAVRYPRGSGAGVRLDGPPRVLEVGRGEVVRHGSRVAFLCLGPVVHYAIEAAHKLEASLGVSATVVNARFAKPLDEELVLSVCAGHEFVYTWEDHALAGGFGSAVLELLADRGASPAGGVRRFGVGDAFVTHGSQAEQHRWNGYDPDTVLAAVTADLTAGGDTPRAAAETCDRAARSRPGPGRTPVVAHGA